LLDKETGECEERQLNHKEGEAERFYCDLKQREISVRMGIEATGYARWFERLLAELGYELWIGDPAQIKTKRVRKHKTDRQGSAVAETATGRSLSSGVEAESRESHLQQVLWHRHRMVQMRTRVINQRQALAMNEGRICAKHDSGLLGGDGQGLVSGLLLSCRPFVN
jgi:transposase